MGSALSLRQDFDGVALRGLARQAKDANQARRLLSLALIYDGGSRADAARLGSVSVQIVRDWVERFNARGADGLINGKAPGSRSKLNEAPRHYAQNELEKDAFKKISPPQWRKSRAASHRTPKSSFGGQTKPE